MNKPVALALILITLTTCILVTQPVGAVSEDSWTNKAPLPMKIEGLGVAVANGKIYAFGGYPGSIYNINEMYDPASNTWTTLAPMPTERVNFGIAVYHNKIYVIGGENGTWSPPSDFEYYSMEIVTGANEVYDPATNTWETKTPMPTPRNYLQANVVDGKIYLIGGQAQQPLGAPAEHSSNLTEVYDPATDSWTTMASIPTTVFGYASAVVNNKIYVISGWSVNNPLSNQVQIFDPKTNSWSLGKPISNPVRQAAAGATSGIAAPKRIYVIGGSKQATTMGGEYAANITQIYNPESDVWSNGAEMPTERYGLAVAVVNDLLYALGGASSSLTDANEQYTPFGYGTVTPPPSPSPPPTPSPTPTAPPSESPNPSASPSPSGSQQPASSPSPQPTRFPTELIYATAASTAAIAAIITAVVVLRRRKQ